MPLILPNQTLDTLTVTNVGLFDRDRKFVLQQLIVRPIKQLLQMVLTYRERGTLKSRGISLYIFNLIERDCLIVHSAQPTDDKTSARVFLWPEEDHELPYLQNMYVPQSS